MENELEQETELDDDSYFQIAVDTVRPIPAVPLISEAANRAAYHLVNLFWNGERNPQIQYLYQSRFRVELSYFLAHAVRWSLINNAELDLLSTLLIRDGDHGVEIVPEGEGKRFLLALLTRDGEAALSPNEAVQRFLSVLHRYTDRYNHTEWVPKEFVDRTMEYDRFGLAFGGPLTRSAKESATYRLALHLAECGDMRFPRAKFFESVNLLARSTFDYLMVASQSLLPKVRVPAKADIDDDELGSVEATN